MPLNVCKNSAAIRIDFLHWYTLNLLILILIFSQVHLSLTKFSTVVAKLLLLVLLWVRKGQCPLASNSVNEIWAIPLFGLRSHLSRCMYISGRWRTPFRVIFHAFPAWKICQNSSKCSEENNCTHQGHAPWREHTEFSAWAVANSAFTSSVSS